MRWHCLVKTGAEYLRHESNTMGTVSTILCPGGSLRLYSSGVCPSAIDHEPVTKLIVAFPTGPSSNLPVKLVTGPLTDGMTGSTGAK